MGSFRQAGKKSSRARLSPRQAGCGGYRDITLLLAVHLRMGSKLDSFICHAPALSEISSHQITSQDQTERTSWNAGHNTTHPPAALLCSSSLDNESLRFEEPKT